MPLFPAYATEDIEDVADNDDTRFRGMVWEGTESTEAQLLASESEEEAPGVGAAPPPLDPFYQDCRRDRGNLRVSTLYFPGRPHMVRETVVSGFNMKQLERYERRREPAGGVRGARGRRYWARRAAEEPDAPAAAERAAAYRDLLLKRPEDVHLWDQYIDFQEACGGAEAALAAAEQAAERAPRSWRLRARLLGAARAALPRARLVQRLRDLLADEKCSRARAELWGALVEAAGAAGGSGAARAAAAAALGDTRGAPPAYPRLLHAYGVFLRTAGLWEELVLLLELAGSMAGALPAASPAPASDGAERRLREAEERALASGLPLPALWVRLERARAAAHWRPARAADTAELAADPQRVPLAHELADLLRPLVGAQHVLLLCGTLLRLAKVPLFPESEYMARAWGAAPGDCAEALLPLLRAARRLPATHPARPPRRAARLLLATLLDPPHYFTDDSGFLRWVGALWDSCCGWASGERRAALLGWRLRWLHALLLLVDPAEEGGAAEVRRIRDEARGALQRFAADGAEGAGAPLAFAQYARIELAASGPERAARVAGRALRAALLDRAAPPHHALYVARVVCEVSGGGGGGAVGARALVDAVCGRAYAGDEPPPTGDELRVALHTCEERCAELERRYAAGEDEPAGEAAQCLGALLPGEAEWGAARALLAPPARRARLLRALPAMAQTGELSASGERYYEQSACALLFASAREHGVAARALSRLFPHNAYLALAAAGAPLWARRGALEPPALPPAPRAPSAALAALLPALLRAQSADWAPPEAEACVRAARRVCGAAAGGAGAGALLGALRLEAETRAPRPRLLPALYEALDRTPHDKWLHVRGAAACGGEAATLHDALLDKQLRAHALLDELAALAPH